MALSDITAPESKLSRDHFVRYLVTNIVLFSDVPRSRHMFNIV